MQDPRFSDSVLGGRFKIQGRTLRPFSYWHIFQLEAIESPFIDGKGIDDVPALVNALDHALRICRTRYPKPAKGFPKRLRWLAKPMVLLRLRKLDGDALALARYIEFHTQGPEFWIPDGGGVPKGQMPRALAGVAALMMLGLSEREAWNYPVGRGEWMKAARSSHQGDELDFIEPESEETRDKLAELKYGMAALCQALKTGGNAVEPAEKLRGLNLLTGPTYETVLAWQKAKGGKRQELLEQLERDIPDLTLEQE